MFLRTPETRVRMYYYVIILLLFSVFGTRPTLQHRCSYTYNICIRVLWRTRCFVVEIAFDKVIGCACLIYFYYHRFFFVKDPTRTMSGHSFLFYYTDRFSKMTWNNWKNSERMTVFFLFLFIFYSHCTDRSEQHSLLSYLEQIMLPITSEICKYFWKSLRTRNFDF